MAEREHRAQRPHRAAVRVLGEGTVATVDLREGITMRELLNEAGTTPRETGWDLFLDGRPARLDTPVDHTRAATLAYVPRTRGG